MSSTGNALSRRLRIGVSACFFHADPTRPIFKGKTLQYFEQSLVHWILSQGALAYLIPAVNPVVSDFVKGVQLKDIVADLDGLILQGGSDVSPTTYGETELDPRWKGDAVRDQYEIELLRQFMKADKPVLGICRGAQLINVALGGTLYQDIEMQCPEAINHRNWEIYDQNFHDITIAPGSELSRIYGGHTSGRTNTIHHQAIQKLGKHLRVEARCQKDGIIEAIRLDPATSEGRFVAAVQWHPEFHRTGDDPLQPELLSNEPLLRDYFSQVQKRLRLN